jgi:aryl-alcohol dehydrogenase-like predicted oxidoreductase
MKYREFGRTGWQVSEIGFGAWAIGSAWGEVPEDDALAALHAAIDKGVNFIDTADVYGDGRSERLVAKLLKARTERIYVATKAGRRLDPHVPEGFNRQNLSAFVERSLRNLEVETIDLIQLHCPPTQVYYIPEVFGILDDLVKMGKLRHYGVSVEKVEEALKATEFPNVQSVQIIFNIFRQRPTERFFDLALERKVGILARVPLASGLLSGKMNLKTIFDKEDHRNYNRYGQAFDVGETFSGVDYETGLAAVEELRPMVPEGANLAQFALRWILMFEAVSLAIPGAKNPAQAMINAAASDLAPLSPETMRRTVEIYEQYVKGMVHQRW